MTPLKARMLRQIAQSGPILLADFWAQCLFDPEYGYYTTGYPIGAEGDFITAPEVSQMFGELIAAWWLATVRQNRIKNITLVEIGPGRGTLMADMLRTFGKLDPALTGTLAVHMVEISPRLTRMQQEKLAGSGFRIQWHKSIETLPAMPLGIVANELFDAIPIRAFIKHGRHWLERAVTVDAEDNLMLQGVPVSLNNAILPSGHKAEKEGTIFEFAPAREATMQSVASRIAKSGGFGLFIDYGHSQTGFGDTLQAVRHHAYADPLDEPGKADLTSHVDFQALANAALQGDARVYPVIGQGAFLERLGIAERTQQLSRSRPDMREAFETACERLTGNDQMGSLFKVLGISSPGFALPVLDVTR